MTFAERLVEDMRSMVDAAVIAQPPRLVPPKKLAVKWKLAKLATVELAAPLATLAGADLDADGKGELYAVTAREVVAFGLGGKGRAPAGDKKLVELGRVAFSGERALLGPRDVVATAVVDGTRLVATVSTWARGMRVSWRKGALIGEVGEPGFMQCPGELAQLAPGRNYFGDPTSGSYATRCGSALVDGDGYPLRVRGQLSLANKLDLTVERCAATNLGCQLAARHEYAGVGVAFEIADVDRDGTPELISSAAVPPGEPDALKVISIGQDDKKPRLKKAIASGGIAGIAFIDIDGDGAREIITATRVLGTARVELWRIE